MIRWIFRRPKLRVLVAILFLSSLYLYVFPAANLGYVTVVLLHAVVGVVAAGFSPGLVRRRGCRTILAPMFWRTPVMSSR